MKKKFILATIVTSILLLNGCSINGVDVKEGVKEAAQKANEEVEAKYSTNVKYKAKVYFAGEVIELELTDYITSNYSEKVKLITTEGETYITSFSNVFMEEIE